MLHLATTGLARGNDSDSVAARGVDHHQNSPQSVHAQGHEPLLAFGIRVFDRDAARVAKRLFRMRKIDPVLAKIGPSLSWVEFDVIHRLIMHIICILSSRPIPAAMVFACRHGATLAYNNTSGVGRGG